MFLDLDNFKPLNDQHGHDAGDMLLIEVAHRLKQCVREADTVARFGGDEFVVVLSDLGLDQDAAMAHAMGVNFVPRLRQAIGAPNSVLERVYKFSAGEQISIFQSAPRPVGANNTDRAYSPLWRLVLVTWRAPQHRRELTSEEELLAAQEAGHLALALTDIVVNCPVTKTVGAEGLAGVR